MKVTALGRSRAAPEVDEADIGQMDLRPITSVKYRLAIMETTC